MYAERGTVLSPILALDHPPAAPGESPPSPMDGFGEVARWITWLRAQGRAERSTVRLYRAHVTRFLADCVKGHPAEATEDHVATFLAEVGPQGPAGRYQAFCALRAAFRYWLRRGVVYDDPTSFFNVEKAPKPKRVALAEERLFRYIQGAWMCDPTGLRAWALMLSFAIGTRRTELASIKPEDDHGDRVFLRNCKRGKTRWVEVGPFARTALESLRPWHNGTILGGVKPDTITDWAREAALAAGLREEVRGRVHHVLRASFITHLLNNGTPPQVVMDLAGHEDLSTTTAYAVSFKEDRIRAVRSFTVEEGT